MSALQTLRIVIAPFEHRAPAPAKVGWQKNNLGPARHPLWGTETVCARLHPVGGGLRL